MTLPLTGGGHLTGDWAADPLSSVSDDQLFGFDGNPPPRFYRPQDHPELPFEIAKLANAPDDEIVRFAKRWGLLGYIELENGRRVRAFVRAVPGAEISHVGGGDPLPWIREHGRRMRLCIALADPLNDSDPEAVMVPLRQFFERESELGNWADVLRIHLFFGEGRPEPEPIKRALATAPLKVARLLLHDLVNEGIEGIEPRLELGQFGEEEGPRVTFYFDAMIQVAYLHVAHLLAEKASIGYCDECGSPFAKTDARQRFCPPGPFSSESRCGYRHRYKKKPRSEWRKTAKKGKAT